MISITDGQIFLNSALFYKGQRPAIDVGTSVSRVGAKAQTAAVKKVAGTLKLDLAQFQELERFSEFTEELDAQTRQLLERGKRMRELLKQADLRPLSFEKETAMIFAGVKGFLDDVPMEKIGEFKENLLKEIGVGEKEILAKIRETRELNSDAEAKLEEVIKNAKKAKN